MSTPVVVNEEEFDLAVEVIENEEGSTVEEDAIIDPDGNIAVEIEGSSITEKGQGLLEWMALSGTVAFIVLLFFSVCHCFQYLYHRCTALVKAPLNRQIA